MSEAPSTATVIHTPLCPILNEIVRAAENGFAALAVAMTVALPDICVALASSDGRSGKVKEYKDWCDNNLPMGTLSFITSDDLWSLRSGFLHQGRFGDLQHNVARIIFALPQGTTFVNCKIGDAYVHSVVDFCKTITAATHIWMEKHHADANIQANMASLVQYRTDFPPYMKGVPMLA